MFGLICFTSTVGIVDRATDFTSVRQCEVESREFKWRSSNLSLNVTWPAALEISRGKSLGGM